MKTETTKIIERVLYDSLFGSNPSLANEFGTTEVKIGFGKELRKHQVKNEYVDFMSYDVRKQIFRCYEIKTSMSDFHSDANLSWYGNYNYLVLSDDLYYQRSLEDWQRDIPEDVGIIIVNINLAKSLSDPRQSKEVVKKPKLVEQEPEVMDFLKDSLIRALFYQNNRKKRGKRNDKK